MISPPPLRIRGLAKSVPGGRILFEGLDLDLAAGEIAAVMGESGAGKSTLLNLIAGLDSADAGEIEIVGRALSGLDEAGRTRLRREHLGFVFQAFHILPHLTLAQNTALPLVLAGISSGEALSRAAEMLAAVGLGGRESDLPSRLSGGELQRTAIGLLLQAARTRGAAVLLVTHSARAAEAADRILFLGRHGLEARRAA
jgi:putative ABC transport system ATP-binding protein